MNYKIRKDIDTIKMLKRITLCKNDVHFETSDGNSLNLKSQLNKMVFLFMIKDKKILGNGYLSFSCPKDAESLYPYVEQ